ncbi:MAG: Tim44/TimA family putative adaptor protein [Zymomonas mobilis]|uniref:Putative lipid-binding transport protein (Tim44 family) n=1 Tax=Zymomonas mobilis TaxID=542 RepID=A0A542W2Y2_ZYMMB|nr:Tim44/TimA family putative adaptor protein [Zymomonas mobilis]TQL17941.1 putative lipid-binding transport protein (Tim44 family) [Zymomonas mobilis]
MVEIVVLVVVAAGLCGWLYNVLGRRTGHEQSFSKPAEVSSAVAAQPNAALLIPATEEKKREEVVQPEAWDGIRRIVSRDAHFDLTVFIEGAKDAYGKILEAFWQNDRKKLVDMVSKEVLEAFELVMGKREADGDHLENRLVNIDKAMVQKAGVDGDNAIITVSYDAWISTMLRNKEGVMIAGSSTDALPTHDVWTFSRNIKQEPKTSWLLVETLAAS